MCRFTAAVSNSSDEICGRHYGRNTDVRLRGNIISTLELRNFKMRNSISGPCNPLGCDQFRFISCLLFHRAWTIFQFMLVTLWTDPQVLRYLVYMYHHSHANDKQLCDSLTKTCWFWMNFVRTRSTDTVLCGKMFPSELTVSCSTAFCKR